MTSLALRTRKMATPHVALPVGPSHTYRYVKTPQHHHHMLPAVSEGRNGKSETEKFTAASFLDSLRLILFLAFRSIPWGWGVAFHIGSHGCRRM